MSVAYNIIVGLVLGLAGGIAIGVNLMDIVAKRRGWYGNVKDEVKVEE